MQQRPSRQRLSSNAVRAGDPQLRSVMRFQSKCRLFVTDHGLQFGTALLSGKTSVNLEIRYAARCSLPEIPSEEDVGFARSTTQLRILGAFVVMETMKVATSLNQSSPFKKHCTMRFSSVRAGSIASFAAKYS